MAQRKSLVAGNWKMNKDYAQAVALAQELSYKSEAWNCEACICPTHLALKGVANVISFDKAAISLGAQNVSAYDDGAYTGEISARMLKAVPCQYCIVGHSERRQLLLETDQQIADKISALITHEISPILCCGEPEVVYQAGGSEDFVEQQIKAALESLSSDYAKDSSLKFDLVVAYEPIWAIGSNQVASPEHANKVCQRIRESLAELFDEDLAQKTRILYGGSVKAANSALFFEQEHIDGALVGGASLDAQEFSDIVVAAAKSYSGRD